MDRPTVVRVVREIKIIRYIGINDDTPDVYEETPSEITPIITQPELPPAPKEKYKCRNIFILLIHYAIGIGSICLGASSLNECPAEKMLPIGLVIFGGIIMVSRILNCVYDCRSISEEDNTEDPPEYLRRLNLLFCLAQFGMFVAVCYWAFSLSLTHLATDPKDQGLDNYCEHDFFNISFYGCIAGVILFFFPTCYVRCCQ